MSSGRILVIDNYDSFVYNLVQYLGQLSVETVVWRNDEDALGTDDAAYEAAVAGFDGVLLSPGPGTPQRAGATMPLVGVAARTGKPLLGVCLGHQAIGAYFGGTVDRAPELLHGKTSLVYHENTGVLAGLPSPFTATRYHSLTVVPETIPDELMVTGRTDTGIVMAMMHRDLPIHGVQFHPESVLTQGGHRMLANWLTLCGIDVPEATVAELEAQMASAIG
ncbi:aminodeoxychorismate/anthranilate synthase component II [Gordonia amarae]|uniref:Anthranilate synthase component II n=2 Tax=Gordonia amarae TaxID=36821 RepID=G7GQ59_9ACTN|nr:aminodeoxychorismate/anthranilate synthase component II [Gordonia amarae]MCS3876763.1 para-aminobenzoate synthetase component 2 [Gordonia amarae]QHN15610.1 aminodeoxychorismate/anthranilate synthase component II [Gordonia amarae]QHN20179.1 aminodeoxychorismate/anthranilate synthase component II [Gordonia amarae]QHN29030.1 aminodeoxychorismate/anthranilate synthase component II [Gordonia amarae]QHN37811.1 aminodeoxychorismate/anthranilate synthase component II [Gordonia amarae]